MNKKRSSKLWLRKHFSDLIVIKKVKKIRSRSWFKLEEINRYDRILKPSMFVADLGSGHGGWSQYAVNVVGKKGFVAACDIVNMRKIDGVTFFKGDLKKKETIENICEYFHHKKFHVVMSDMSPCISGINIVDISKSLDLADLALNICHKILASRGSFIVKLFYGKGFENYLMKIRLSFKFFKVRRLRSSFSSSSEVYIICKNYKR